MSTSGVIYGINTHSIAVLAIYWAYLLAIALPTLGVSVRRLHDTGRSAWWLLITLIPIVEAIVLLIFYVQDSGPDNRYGSSPKVLARTSVA